MRKRPIGYVIALQLACAPGGASDAGDPGSTSTDATASMSATDPSASSNPTSPTTTQAESTMSSTTLDDTSGPEGSSTDAPTTDPSATDPSTTDLPTSSGTDAGDSSSDGSSSDGGAVCDGSPSGDAEIFADLVDVACVQTSCPLQVFYRYKKDQFLIFAQDLQDAGVPCGAAISTISLRVAAVPTAVYGLRVAAMATELAVLDGLVEMDPLPEVAFGPADLDTGLWANGEWTEIALDAPIVWDGASNLLLELSLDDAADASDSSGGIYVRQTGDAMGRHEGGYTHSNAMYPFIGINNVVHDGAVPALRITW